MRIKHLGGQTAAPATPAAAVQPEQTQTTTEVIVEVLDGQEIIMHVKVRERSRNRQGDKEATVNGL